MNSESLDKVKGKLSGKTSIFLILGCAGILLIFFSSIIKKEEKVPVSEDFSLASYITQTEHSLQTIVSSITGEKNPVIMVTAENSVQQVYAKENKSSGTGEQSKNEESYVLIKGSGGAQNPVKITEIQPEIKGVVVVSRYADDFVIQEKLINAVRTALDLSSSKVCVVSAKKGS